jgi:hypothetical protein
MVKDVQMIKKDELKVAKRKVESFKLDTEWYDFWHIHLDNWGQGNKSIEEHKKFIKLYLELLCQIPEQANTLKTLWQTWVEIDPIDSSQDSLYFHTPNPNKDNFPYDFSTVKWGIGLPKLLEGINENGKYTIGESYYNDYLFYYIKLK